LVRGELKRGRPGLTKPHVKRALHTGSEDLIFKETLKRPVIFLANNHLGKGFTPA